MRLISERGTFESFQHLRASYLTSSDGSEYWIDPRPWFRGDWEKDKLHASEIGGCPRATAYRLLGTPEKPRSVSSAANREVMFSSGFYLHFLTYSALNWADLLFTHEHPLDLGDGWSGTLDAVIRPDYRKENEILYDMKTVLPTALKYSYDMPKEKDCLQLGVYGTVRPELTGVVEYADRAGSNDPFICEFELAPWVEKAKELMLVFEAMRDDLPKLPLSSTQGTWDTTRSRGASPTVSLRPSPTSRHGGAATATIILPRRRANTA